MRIKRDDLIELVEKIAFHHHDGNLIILKSKKGYKVIFGALPNIENLIPIATSMDDDLFLDDALHLALIQQPTVNDKRAKAKTS